jgi:hypothetical protein
MENLSFLWCHQRDSPEKANTERYGYVQEFLAGLLSHSRNPKFDNRGRRCVMLIRVLAACMDG